MRGAFLVLLLVSYVIAEGSLEGHRVLRVVPKTISHLDFLSQLFHSSNSNADFWTPPYALNRIVDIHVGPQKVEEISASIEANGMNVTTWIYNLQELVNQQLTPAGPGFFQKYPTYEEVIAWSTQLEKDYPTLVTLVEIGTTYEGRKQVALKLTSPSKQSKKVIWFDAAIHAREWVTVTTVAYIAEQLVKGYGSDKDSTDILDNLEVYVLPIFNVDGYVYSWTSERLWRKTRTPNKGTTCIGTDPNRNWDWKWGGAGVSTDPCSDIYCGPQAFSEPCVINVAKFLMNLSYESKFVGYIAFHAYSQLWMTPWGYTATKPTDYGIQYALAGECVSALQAVHGTRYKYGPIATTIYPASGGSVDWTYGALAIVQSVAPELRDEGQYGFLLPPEEIIPTGEETLAAVKVYARSFLP